MRLEDNAGALHATPNHGSAVLVSLPPDVAQVARARAGGQPLDAWVCALVLAARPPLSPAEKQRAYRARKAQQPKEM